MDGIAKIGPQPGLAFLEFEKPRIGPNDVLVETIASSICGTDIHLYNWDNYCAGLRMIFPRIIGHETVGKVAEIGSLVKTLRVGDIVSAESHLYCDSCGPCRSGRRELCTVDRILGEDSNGSFAQFFALDERFLWRHDPRVDLRLACICEPLGNAVNMLTQAGVSTKSVVIIGAGPIGLFTAILAKHYGAATTFVVEPAEYRRSTAKAIGADVVLDPTSEDVPKFVTGHTEGQGAEVCLEISGTAEGLRMCLDTVRPGGLVVAFGIPNGMVEIDLTRKLVLRGVSLVGVTGRRVWETWTETSSLIGPLGPAFRKVITHEYPYTKFEEAFEELSRRRCGKIMLWFPR